MRAGVPEDGALDAQVGAPAVSPVDTRPAAFADRSDGLAAFGPTVRLLAQLHGASASNGHRVGTLCGERPIDRARPRLTVVSESSSIGTPIAHSCASRHASRPFGSFSFFARREVARRIASPSSLESEPETGFPVRGELPAEIPTT